MTTHIVRDPDYEARVRSSFLKQRFMATLGATLTRIEPGEVEIALSFREDLTQQHGFMHAGGLAAVVDSACGYAALTLMEPGVAVLSIEFKINMLSPASGMEFRAVGRVVRAGRNVTVVSGEVLSGQTVVAVLQGTMMSVRGKSLVD